MPGQRLNRNQHTARRARWRGRTIFCTALGLLAPAFAMAGTMAPAVAMTLPVVSSGGGHSCALMPDQSVWCWGHNNTGQLGSFSGNQSTVPVQVPTIPAAIGIAAGYGHSCAIDTTNIIWCWGSDAFGELGDGTTKYDSAPGQVMSIKASQVSAGNGLTCAVSLAHKAYCWGDNNYGELGDGTNSDSSTPKLVKGLTGVQAVAAGYFHACALLLSGAIYCWGDNTFGALGDGTTTDANTPVLVIEGGATAIAGGFDDTCAILSGGDLKCWGDNGVGELGDGTDVNALVPTQVSGLTSGVSQVTLGEDFTCALAATPTTTALCWGDADGHGELGNGSFDEQDPSRPRSSASSHRRAADRAGPSRSPRVLRTRASWWSQRRSSAGGRACSETSATGRPSTTPFPPPRSGCPSPPRPPTPSPAGEHLLRGDRQPERGLLGPGPGERHSQHPVHVGRPRSRPAARRRRTGVG